MSAWKGLHYRYSGPRVQPRDEVRTEPEFLPASLQDAYEVLNVNPATPRHVVAKLVTCLRQAWHPDHGAPGERELRTMKLQQINAAWEIVTGKRRPSRD